MGVETTREKSVKLTLITGENQNDAVVVILGKDEANTYLHIHIYIYIYIYITGRSKGPPPTPHSPYKDKTYRISNLWAARGIACLIKGCPGRKTIRSALRVLSVRRYVQDTLVILEDGSHPVPFCPKCYMFVSWRDINGKHQSTAMCERGE